MKKLVVIALAFFTLNGVAQEKRNQKADRNHGSELRKEMTPDEIADLRAKKMTLKLDLTDAQQEQVQVLFLEQAETKHKLRENRKVANGEKKERPSKDELVKMQNHRLDEMIEMKRKIKTILTAEQYAKYEKIKPRQHRKRSNHKKRR